LALYRWAADGVDLLSVRSPLDRASCQVLFQGVDAVLANSAHEPFGLVGLEAMAAGGVACTGGSGEDYAVPGYNALVLETEAPEEFLRLFARLRAHPAEERALRRAGRLTARQYAWPQVVRRVLLPRLLGKLMLSPETVAVPKAGREIRCPRRDLHQGPGVLVRSLPRHRSARPSNRRTPKLSR
jgi:hypothetical protein